MGESAHELVATTELARRLGYSESGVRKLERLGRIPAGLTITGSRQRVWRGADIPQMKTALQKRPTVTEAAAGVAA